MANSNIAQALKPEELEQAIEQAFGHHPEDILMPLKICLENMSQICELSQCVRDISKSDDDSACHRIGLLADTAMQMIESCSGTIGRVMREYASNLHQSGVMSTEALQYYESREV